ncbi:glycoside hydrolase family 66 protein [Paenibacillus segetis]|uniref:Cycloisomaltooligosaccharide glucanotransferase n=1 Tax=Paenibacillus segetis TaxID=1325360 RepID=A0ABQ1YC04_9BACL|nr:glycoside hydrolase family 66 protein [Paenibacillus segetis]GGH19099.1 cycloisomaltooligosaccharide glucanotransferase [Paenibacillus segetis]
MRFLKIIGTVSACLLTISVVSGCENVLDQAQIDKSSVKIIQLTTDKAMYDPTAQVKVIAKLENVTDKNVKGNYTLTVSHLAQQVGEVVEGNFSVTGYESTNIEIPWTAPDEDYKGYLFDFQLQDNKGNTVTSETMGVDVSSEWTKFPRYGYVTEYSDKVDTEKVMETLKDFRLNAIEYYDWKYLHHQPVPADGSMEWEDWAGRKISGQTVKDYIAAAKDRNMVNMSYNMIYAATNNFAEFGVKDEWGLWYAENHGGPGQVKGDRFTFHMGASPSGQSDLYFFDIQNQEWQDYIIKQNIEAIQTMGFDGWHGDTVGEWGKMWTSDNRGDDMQTLYVKDGYTEFLNKAKEMLGQDKYLAFNPVGAQGIENVNKSNVDVLYTEMWPWDHDSEGNQYDTYMGLKREIDQSRQESGGKSLIIPAYMEYDYAQRNSSVPFNMSAVLLTDAAVYAAGGSRIELGDGVNMLSNEYFPYKNLYMTPEHVKRQSALQDFIVAYQNLLRDGQEDNGNLIEVADYDSSIDGQAQTIWAYSKSDTKYDTIQMINLVDVSTDDWRANEGEKDTPRMLSDVRVRYYSEKNIQSAWVTSPDPAYNSRSHKLDFTKGSDANGSYVELTVPSLEYWNMLYFSEEDTAASTHNESIGQVKLYETKEELANGDIKSGLDHWSLYNDVAQVKDGKIVFEGLHFAQSMSQTVTGLEDGTYEVSLTGKQYGMKAHISRMELTGTGYPNVFVDLPVGESTGSIKQEVRVRNGRLKITIHHESILGSNLEIDEVKLKKVE